MSPKSSGRVNRSLLSTVTLRSPCLYKVVKVRGPVTTTLSPVILTDYANDPIASSRPHLNCSSTMNKNGP